MGHLFTKEGLKLDPDKAKEVLEMPRPEDLEGVQRLNGFVNYLYTTFIMADRSGGMVTTNIRAKLVWPERSSTWQPL